MQSASSFSGLDIVGIGDSGAGGQYSSDKHDEIEQGQRLVLEAQRHLKDAKYKLSLGGDTTDVGTVEVGGTEMTFDLFADNLIADLSVHSKISRSLGEIDGAIARVDKLIATLS